MKTYTDLIDSWIDCDGTKVYKPKCDCLDGMYSETIFNVIDHIKYAHPRIYTEYEFELSRVDKRIKLRSQKL